MSWKEKMKEWGGGDLAFLSEDGESIIFVVVAEPVLLEGKYKGKPSEKIGCPVFTEDGFVLLVVGKRLGRKLAKYEDVFDSSAFVATRHGEAGDIESRYELKILGDLELRDKLLELKRTEFDPVAVNEAVAAAIDVMQS